MMCFIESMTVCIGTKNFAAVPFFWHRPTGKRLRYIQLKRAASRHCRIYVKGRNKTAPSSRIKLVPLGVTQM